MGRLGCVDIENFCVFGLESDKSSSPLQKIKEHVSNATCICQTCTVHCFLSAWHIDQA
jgi:H2-forming N5,N10-methylenetetrahydromethanopterin dehydrogenase-like enzyme